MRKKPMSIRCTFSDLISMDEKSTLFRCIFWCNLDRKLMQLGWHILMWFWKTKTCGYFDISFLITFWYIKKESCFNIPFGRNIVLMYIFKVIRSTLNLLGDHTLLKNIYTSRYLVLFYLLVFKGFFLANTFWNIAGNR